MKGYPFEVAVPDGLRVSGIVLSDQLKSLDWRAREAKFADRLPPSAVADVVALVSALLAEANG